MRKREEIEESSGNVFADIGVKNPAEALAKAELTRQICKIIEKKKMTQQEVADLLGMDQPKVSLLLNGRFSGFSTDRLLRVLNSLGRDVDIVIKFVPRNRKQGEIHVVEPPKKRKVG